MYKVCIVKDEKQGETQQSALSGRRRKNWESRNQQEGEKTLKHFLWVLLHFNLTVVKSQYRIFYSYL